MKPLAVLLSVLAVSVASAQTTTPTPLLQALTVIGDGSRPLFVGVTISPTLGYLPSPSVGIVAPPLFFGPRAYPASGRFLNFSFRGFAGPGDQSVIAGLVVSEGARVVMVRAVGPTLSMFGISGVLLRPQLQIFDSSGTSIARSVPWSANDAAIRVELRKTAADVGAFALREDSDDQVLLLFLRRGAYTCVVSGNGDSTGIVLLEAYEVP